MPLWLCCCFYSLESKHNKLSERLLSVVMMNGPTSKPQHFSFSVALVQQETLLLAIYVKQYTKYTRHIWQLFVVLAFFLITKERINILRKAHENQSTEHNYICQLTNIYLFNSPTKEPFMMQSLLVDAEWKLKKKYHFNTISFHFGLRWGLFFIIFLCYHGEVCEENPRVLKILWRGMFIAYFHSWIPKLENPKQCVLQEEDGCCKCFQGAF